MNPYHLASTRLRFSALHLFHIDRGRGAAAAVFFVPGQPIDDRSDRADQQADHDRISQMGQRERGRLPRG